MEASIEGFFDHLFTSKKFEKFGKTGKIVYKCCVKDKTRVIELLEGSKFIIIYTFSENKTLISVEDRFYEGINRFNEEMNTLSAEYDAEEEILRLKSSIIRIPGINIEKAIDYYLGIHDKYFENFNKAFADINEETDIENIGGLIKQKSSNS